MAKQTQSDDALGLSWLKEARVLTHYQNETPDSAALSFERWGWACSGKFK